MKAYKDKKKYVSCQEFIYRVQIAYKNWMKQYEELMEVYKNVWFFDWKGVSFWMILIEGFGDCF